MYKFVFVILFTIILKINYLNALEFAAKNGLEEDSFVNKRSKRQSQICTTPNIQNGKVKILRQKSNGAGTGTYLLLNINCDHNYILYPPNNNIILCINGDWDSEIPQCIQCGQRADNAHKPFIVNGTLSKFGDFPWHVGIYKKEPSNSHPLYICGGSIINDKTILTVAHCFTDQSGKISTLPEYFIGAGKYYSNYNSDKDNYAQKRKVARIDIHPQYKGYFSNYAWDIAVIIMDEPFEISNLVQPICVDWMNDFENEQLIPRNIGEIAGWGTTETNLVASSQELRVLKVPFIKPGQCTNLVPKEFIRYITPDKFCAGYTNGSSVCGGDSGGGLVFKKDEDKDVRFYIRGLVSVGVQIDGRCDDYKYSTYTRVSDYLSFIQNSISNKIIPTTPAPVTTTTTQRTTTTSVACLTPNGEHAKCVSIYECKIFLDALQNNPTADQQKYMRDSRCGQQEELTVCCGSTTNYLATIHGNPVTTNPIVHRNLNLLPSPGICGRQTAVRQARIFGGNVTTLLDYPWMAMLEFGSKERSTGLLCAGTLISDRYVLTAGHCASKSGSNNVGPIFRVRLGEYNTATETDCVILSKGTGNLPNGRDCADPVVNVDVEEVIAHPLFSGNSRGPRNDIALLRLAEKVTFTDFIKPICLPLNEEKSPPGRQMVISGWGRTESSVVTTVKRKAFLPAVSNEECVKIYKENSNVEILSSHVCAGGEEGIDSCSGDTGGPLMGTLSSSRDFYVEGIISFGPRNCGTYQFPSVATRVSEYIEWILDNIKP